jgi:phage terminase large subunit-like protein
VTNEGADRRFERLETGKAAFERVARRVCAMAKFAAAEKNGMVCGIVIAALRSASTNIVMPQSYPQIGPNTGMVGGP